MRPESLLAPPVRSACSDLRKPASARGSGALRPVPGTSPLSRAEASDGRAFTEAAEQPYSETLKSKMPQTLDPWGRQRNATSREPVLRVRSRQAGPEGTHRPGTRLHLALSPGLGPRSSSRTRRPRTSDREPEPRWPHASWTGDAQAGWLLASGDPLTFDPFDPSLPLSSRRWLASPRPGELNPRAKDARVFKREEHRERDARAGVRSQLTQETPRPRLYQPSADSVAPTTNGLTGHAAGSSRRHQAPGPLQGPGHTGPTPNRAELTQNPLLSPESQASRAWLGRQAHQPTGATYTKQPRGRGFLLPVTSSLTA